MTVAIMARTTVAAAVLTPIRQPLCVFGFFTRLGTFLYR
jgi:hypothetical protein